MESSRKCLWLLVGILCVCLASSQQLQQTNNVNPSPSANSAGEFALKMSSILNTKYGASNQQGPAPPPVMPSTVQGTINPPYNAVGQPADNGMNTNTNNIMMWLPLLRSLRKKKAGGGEGGAGGGEGGAGGGEGGPMSSMLGAAAAGDSQEQTPLTEGKSKKKNFLKAMMKFQALQALSNMGNQPPLDRAPVGMPAQAPTQPPVQAPGPSEEPMISLQDLMDHMKMNKAGRDGNTAMMRGQPAVGNVQTAIAQPAQGPPNSPPDMTMPGMDMGFAGFDMNMLGGDIFGQGGGMGMDMVAPAIGDGSQEQVGGGVEAHGKASLISQLFGGAGMAGQGHGDMFGKMGAMFGMNGPAGMNPLVSPMMGMMAKKLGMKGKAGAAAAGDSAEQTGPGMAGGQAGEAGGEGTTPSFTPLGQMGMANGRTGLRGMFGMKTNGRLNLFGGLRRPKTTTPSGQDSDEEPSASTTMKPLFGSAPGAGEEAGNESPAKSRKDRLRKLMLLSAMGSAAGGSAPGMSAGASSQDRARQLRNLLALSALRSARQRASSTQAGGEAGGEGGGEGAGGEGAAGAGGEAGAEGTTGSLGKSRLDRQKRMRKLLLLLAMQKQYQNNGATMGGSSSASQSGMNDNQSMLSSNMAGTDQSVSGLQALAGTMGTYPLNMQQGAISLGNTGQFSSGNFNSQWFSKFFNNQMTGGQGEEGGAGGEGAAGGAGEGATGMFGQQGGEGGMGGGEGGFGTGEGSMSARAGMVGYEGVAGMGSFSGQWGAGDGAGNDGEGSGGMTGGSCPSYVYTIIGDNIVFPNVNGNCKLTVKLNFPDVSVGQSEGITGVRADQMSQMTPVAGTEEGQTGSCPKWRMWRVGKYATFIETVPGRCQIVIYAARSNRRGMNVDQVRVNFINSLGGRSRGSGDFGQWTREGFKRLMTAQPLTQQTSWQTQTRWQTQTNEQAQTQAQAQTQRLPLEQAQGPSQAPMTTQTQGQPQFFNDDVTTTSQPDLPITTTVSMAQPVVRFQAPSL